MVVPATTWSTVVPAMTSYSAATAMIRFMEVRVATVSKVAPATIC
jgi:hypothetical protein